MPESGDKSWGSLHVMDADRTAYSSNETVSSRMAVLVDYGTSNHAYDKSEFEIVNEIKVIRMLLLLAPCSLQAREPLDKPNIIFIMADDLGYGDLAAMAGKDPNSVLDQMAESVNLEFLCRVYGVRIIAKRIDDRTAHGPYMGAG